MLLALAAVVGALGAAPADAGEMQPFSLAAFQRAQADGKAILVAVHADWCPVCKRMKPAEDALLKDPKYRDVVAFVVDFDRQPDALKLLKVGSQATQVVFKGAREVGRHSFVTDRAKMEQLLNRASS
jgi:thiol-disulfide isomerase/thioredoxin